LKIKGGLQTVISFFLKEMSSRSSKKTATVLKPKTTSGKRKRDEEPEVEYKGVDGDEAEEFNPYILNYSNLTNI
jgi:hypothetical protein